MVSVFEGQLTRTWYFENEGKKHVLNLYHDTISGVRSAMLDYQEIKGSLGNSSLLMESKGHRIFFNIGKLPGYLEIKRSGWTGFEYGCLINGKVVKEVTQGVPENQDLLFQPKVADTTFTADEHSEYPIAWYVIRTRRITDGVQTTVHRRFREFAELNSQIKQNMKGHHLRDVLPPLPDKPMKQFTDHKDLNFIQERMFKLETFLNNMVSIPHVANMVCMKAFVGIMDQVREYSLTFHVPTLGMSLLPTERQGESGVSPCVVGLIQKPEVCTGVLPGDSVSRVNGVPLGGSTFNGAIARIRGLPRPLIIHFIQVIGARPSPNTGAVGTAAVAEAPGHILDEVPDALAVEEELAERTSAHSAGGVAAVQKDRHSRGAHSPVEFVDVNIVEDPPVHAQKSKSVAPVRTTKHTDAAPVVAPPMFQPAKARTPAAGSSGAKVVAPAAAATATQKTQMKKKAVAAVTTPTVVAAAAPVKETVTPTPAPVPAPRNLSAFEDSPASTSKAPVPTLQHSAESSGSVASITATSQSAPSGKNPLFSSEVEGFGPPSSTAVSASTAKPTPAVTVTQSTAGTAKGSKSALFDDEVPGFSVAPGLSPTTTTTTAHTRPVTTSATAKKAVPSASTAHAAAKPAADSSVKEASVSPAAPARPTTTTSTTTTEATVTQPSRTSYSTAATVQSAPAAAATQPSSSLLGWD